MGDTQALLLMLAAASSCFLIDAGLVYFYLRRNRRAQTWLTAEATVSRAGRHSGNGSTVYTAWYSFVTPDSQIYDGEGQTDELMESGDVIDIVYDPEKPERNHAGFTDIRIWHFLALPIGLLFFAMGILMSLDAFNLVDLS